jgi:N-acetylmuramoyl-L-alanine amidase
MFHLSIRWFFTCVLVWHFSLPVCASADDYDSIQSQHLTLRNRDPEFLRHQDWLALAEAFVAFARDQKQSRFAAKALFDSGDIYQRLSLASQGNDNNGLVGRELRARALYLFASVVDQYPDSDLAPLSLYRMRPLAKNMSEQIQLEDQLHARYPRSREAFLLRDARQQGESSKTGTNVRQSRGVVVLDPGHGGEDFGATHSDGIYEKDLALRLALLLAAELKKIGFDVHLTRRSDIFVPLSERIEFARQKAPNVFVSLHMNSSHSSSTRGIELYIGGKSSDTHTATLVQREEQARDDSRSGSDPALTEIIEGIFSDSKTSESQRLARELYIQLRELRKQEPRFLVKPVRTADFFVLRENSFPAVLIELLYVSNSEDLELLTDRNIQTFLVRTFAFAIERFIDGDTK